MTVLSFPMNSDTCLSLRIFFGSSYESKTIFFLFFLKLAPRVDSADQQHQWRDIGHTVQWATIKEWRNKTKTDKGSYFCLPLTEPWLEARLRVTFPIWICWWIQMAYWADKCSYRHSSNFIDVDDILHLSWTSRSWSHSAKHKVWTLTLLME